MFCSYGQNLLHVKRHDEYETNTDQLTNLGFGGVSSTCPTTKVILHHTWGNLTNTGCLIINKNHFSLPICIQINQYHVERQCIYECLHCDGFNICELITNDLIQ